MCHIITVIIWPWYLAIVMNIIQNLRPRPIFWQATKIKKSVGLNTKNCIANYCKNAPRCRIATYQNLIESACCAQKNPPCNAIAGWPPNILRKKYQTLKLCICKEHKCRPQREWLDCNSHRNAVGPFRRWLAPARLLCKLLPLALISAPHFHH